MKACVMISTPAQYHFYKNIVRSLLDRGNDVKVLYRDYGETLDVAEFKGYVFSRVRTNWDRMLKLPFDVLRAKRYLKDFKPDLVTGFEIYAPYTAKLIRSRCFVFYDSEPRTSKLLALQMRAYLPFIDVILTPSCYLDDLGEKHLRVDSFKELAYLHPNYFKPDKSVLDELGVDENCYAVLRFNAFDAAHDIGVKGFSYEDKVELVKRLSKHVVVLISSEGGISKELEKYAIKISKKKIHHVLYFAKFLLADTGTVATEAAILGAPVINTHPKAKKFGNFLALEKLGLMHIILDSKKAIEKAEEIVMDENLKKEWRNRRKKLLEDKIDITKFMVWFIENYPESLVEFKENPRIQYKFR